MSFLNLIYSMKIYISILTV